MFEEFAAQFERQYDCKIKVLRTDDGKEYNGINDYYKDNGIRRQTTEPYQPVSNGKAEQMHRTLMNMARSMLITAYLPNMFWGGAVMYECYVLNRCPTRSNKGCKSPIQDINR